MCKPQLDESSERGTLSRALQTPGSPLVAWCVGTLVAAVGAWVLCFQGFVSGFRFSLTAWTICLACLMAGWLQLRRTEKHSPVRRRHARAVAFLAVVLAVFTAGHVALVYRTLESVFSFTNAAGCLVNIDGAIRTYVEKHGQYPPTLQEVFDTGILNESWFVTGWDRNRPEKMSNSGRLLYSSFAYDPPATAPADDPDLILAYEREAVGRSGDTLFHVPARAVLFADGNCQILTDSDFAQALVKDGGRRQVLHATTTTAPAPSNHGTASSRSR